MKPQYLEKSAILSECGLYRYQLDRLWSHQGFGMITWVMLNPSTADGESDDATLRRIYDYSYQWGYGALRVVNLFAYRATKPKELFAVPDPIGPKNDSFILNAAHASQAIVAAWGSHGTLAGRAKAVEQLLFSIRLQCLGMTANGQPKHPLRLDSKLSLVDYSGQKMTAVDVLENVVDATA